MGLVNKTCLRLRRFAPESGRWVRFRRHRNGDLVGHLPNGKIVLADEKSEFQPFAPGLCYAAEVVEMGSVAIAYLIHAHRNLRFARCEAFGPTSDGVSYLLNCQRSRRRQIPFVCNPEAERLAIFQGYESFLCIGPHRHEQYYRLRHGEWRLLNWSGPMLMSDEEFGAAKVRVREFTRTSETPYWSSNSCIWSEARRAGVVTEEECSEAARRCGRSWNYVGD